MTYDCRHIDPCHIESQGPSYGFPRICLTHRKSCGDNSLRPCYQGSINYDSNVFMVSIEGY